MTSATPQSHIPTRHPGAGGLRGRNQLASLLPKRHPAMLIELLALVPIVLMIRLVHDSSQLQWFDYWTDLLNFTSPSGSLRPGGLFVFYQGHLPALPCLLYWINLKLTGGLAQPIGYFDIAVVVAQLVILRGLLPSAEQMGGQVWRSLLVVALAVLLFAPQEAWNFSRSGSGQSWLLANLLMICAIALAARGRLFSAVPFAALATFTYGTGLMAWPAIAVIALLRGRRDWRAWSILGASALALIIYVVFESRHPTGTAVGFRPADIARRTLQVMGSVLSPDPEVAPVLGAVGLGLGLGLGITTWRTRRDPRQVLPWIGLVVWAVLAAGLIGIGRGGTNGADLGVTSRYASLSILLWVPVLIMAVGLFRTSLLLWAGAIAIVVLAFSSGQASLDAMNASALQQNELAIALRLGTSTGYPYSPASRGIGVLGALGQYPFDSHFHADCGLLGTSIAPSEIQAPRKATGGHLDGFDQAYNTQSVRLQGWFGTRDGATKCIVITNGQLKVIGAASLGYERPDLATAGSPTGNLDLGFIGVARADARSYRAFAVVSGRQGVYAIPGQLQVPGRKARVNTGKGK